MIGTIELPPGTVIDGWQVVEVMGKGGFGVVHRVLKDGQACALKLALHREHSGDAGRTHARTRREVALLLLLDHPNIIKPRAFGHLPDGRVYLVLEYVEGWTLDQWVERMHPTAKEVARVFMKLAATLAYLHGQGVLHRDLKLTNVLIREYDMEPILIDLGAAIHAHATPLTDAGLPPGTDRYRAPEALGFLLKLGRLGKERYTYRVADEVFALGVMLYEVLTQARPTEGGGLAPLNNPRRALAFASPHEANPRVPVALSGVSMDLLALEPRRRPESMEAVRRELAELAEHQGQEYTVPVHLPSEQRTPEDPEQSMAMVLQEGRESRSRVLASVAGVVLAAAVVSWLIWGRPHPGPAAPPPSRPGVQLSAGSAPAPMTEPDSTPVAPITVPQEGTPVKSKPPDTPTVPRTARASGLVPASTEASFPAWCKTVTLTAALAAGCTGPQLRPQPFVCPPGARDAMKKLGWENGDSFGLIVDDRGPATGEYSLRNGPVVSVKPATDVVTPNRQHPVPAGTRFFGKVYIVPGKTGSGYGQVFVIYDRARLPNHEEYPVCVAITDNSGMDILGKVQGDTATTWNRYTAYIVNYWPWP